MKSYDKFITEAKRRSARIHQAYADPKFYGIQDTKAAEELGWAYYEVISIFGDIEKHEDDPGWVKYLTSPKFRQIASIVRKYGDAMTASQMKDILYLNKQLPRDIKKDPSSAGWYWSDYLDELKDLMNKIEYDYENVS